MILTNQLTHCLGVPVGGPPMKQEYTDSKRLVDMSEIEDTEKEEVPLDNRLLAEEIIIWKKLA